MQSDPFLPIQIEFTPEFKRNLRRLVQRDRGLRSDLQRVLYKLRAGQFRRDPASGNHKLFKIGIDSSAQTGRYSLVYYLPTPQQIVLITLTSVSVPPADQTVGFPTPPSSPLPTSPQTQEMDRAQPLKKVWVVFEAQSPRLVEK